MRLVILALYLVLTLSLSACDWFDDDDDDNSGGVGTPEAVDQTYTETPQAEPAEAAEEDVSATTENVDYTRNYHHWNPRSWDGKGSSIVLCPGAPKYDSCELNGDSLRLHGNRDYGRWIWTNYNTRGLSGKITCTKDGVTVGFEVTSKSSLQYGSC
ncbi:hypothetical protein [Desulfopila sp. IMCC35008]|uniref:hypothetical protein n=1 Tax=Desulfopila sp. IMCC35008 TaxID=2653858 RepID=UPI0013D20CAC|nr:hypothetical protein [Desulfopila sp. IMCC35008]